MYIPVLAVIQYGCIPMCVTLYKNIWIVKTDNTIYRITQLIIWIQYNEDIHVT